MENLASGSGSRNWLGINTSQTLVLTLFFAAGAILEGVKLSSLRDLEIWRHLAVGNWILANRAWPNSGLFSQAADLPWRDVQWGFDVFTAIGYRVLGLWTVPAILICFRSALAVITFFLVGGTRRFWTAIVLACIAQYVLATLGPDPRFVSVLLFGDELIVLLEFRNTGNLRLPYILPPLFVLWANLDSGFVYGLVLFAFFLLEVAIQGARQSPDRLFTAAALAGFACLAATIVNPYGYHPYSAFFAEQSDAINVNLPGYLAMSFRRPQDYVLLLLTMAAFLALGLRRSFDLFLFVSLASATLLAFRAERAGWLLTLTSLAVIGETLRTTSTRESAESPRWQPQSVLAVAILALSVSGLSLASPVFITQQDLRARISAHFPVRACDYIRQHALPHPLFDAQPWGSFLVWYLPEYPVALDGRRGLYSEEEETDYAKVMKADMPYQSFAPMSRAQTLLLEKTSIMGQAFRELPAFQVAYEDDLAIVLVRQSDHLEATSRDRNQ
jgi:hypothetical protein